jgi:hypothetical protein
MAIGPDDTIWLGTAGGLLRWTGSGEPTVFNTLNSPMPATAVHGVAVRNDGLLAVAASDYVSTVPFPCGVCIVNGDPAVASNWTVHGYGTSPLPHYQLGQVAFDRRGDLWVSPLSMGAAILLTGSGVTSVEPQGRTPAKLALSISGANPLRAHRGTDLEFTLPRAGGVARLEIFDAAGRRVRVLASGPQPLGMGRVHWDGAGERGERLPAGIYLARLATGAASQSLKLVLMH